MQPAVFGKGFGRCFGAFPVALHDAWAADLDLVILAEPYFNVREREADSLRLVVIEAVAGDDRRRLSHAVTLDHRHSKPAEYLRDFRVDRGAA